jgi:hypothetical protein
MLDTQNQSLVTIMYMLVWQHPLPILTHTLLKYY